MKRRWTTKNLMVFGPPRHGKSDLCSVYTPTWWLAESPDNRVCVTSYSAELADHWGRQVRNVVEEHSGRLGIRLAKDSSSASRWNIEGQRLGGMFTAGAGGPLSGKGFNLGVIDDPFKNYEEASSQLMRDKVWEWYRWVFLSRMEPDAGIILTMTRWDEDDLAGRLLKQSPDKWTVLCYPAIAEDDDRLGRAPGQALWPSRYNEAALAEKKIEMGTQAYTALYQQRPSPQAGNLLKREWWQYCDQVPGDVETTVQVWDMAVKAKEENDYYVCGTMHRTPSKYVLSRVLRAKMEYPDAKRAVVHEYERAVNAGLTPDVIIIEDSANGTAVSQDLKRDTRLPIILVKAEADKVSRVKPAVGTVEAGNVFLVNDGSGWQSDFVEEAAAFPTGAHDDQVDMFSMGMNYLMDTPTGEPWLEIV